MKKVVVANIQSFQLLDGNQVASVVAATSRVETASDYASKVKSLFGGKLEIVPHSVRNVTASAQLPAVAFHVRSIVESQPYTEEAIAQMRTVVEANVFTDAEDATWEVVEAAGAKRLVKRTDTDISALLAAGMKQGLGFNRVSASYYGNGVGEVAAGSYAIFTNPETATADSGIVFYGEDGGLSVLARSSGNLVPCGFDAIIAASAFEIEYEEGEQQLETAALAKKDVQEILSYYRNLFSTQPSFFAQLEAAVRKRFLLA